MSDYDNNLRGALFKNDRKENENHPDYKGSAEVDGVEYWLSAWLKTDRNNNRYMSLSFKAKDEQRVAPAPAPSPQRQAQPSSNRRSPAPESWDDAPPF